jgi:uncharacterized protein YndB with AHSA1/START domain
METIQFTALINANKQKVWDTMLEDKTYRQWAAAFHEGFTLHRKLGNRK